MIILASYRTSKPFRRACRWTLLLLVLWLQACSSIPLIPSPVSTAYPSNRDQATIQALEAAGEYREAAKAYLRVARYSVPAEAHEYTLRAAELLVKGGYPEDAAALLANFSSATLDTLQSFRVRLLRAHMTLDHSLPHETLRTLNQSPPAQASDRLLTNYHLLRAKAYLQLGNYLESARERVWLDSLLESDAERNDNHRATRDSLVQLSDAMLLRLGTGKRGDVLAGWMEHIYLQRILYDRDTELQSALANWRERFPHHPADYFQHTAPDAGSAITPMPTELPRRVALLLPISGQLAAAGKAIRDGFSAASMASPAHLPRPMIRVYDVGGGADTVVSTYRQALHEGAGLVVGPLDKTSVAALAASGPLQVPVLALNYLDSTETAPPGLLQFGLAPEDEAVNVARKAWLDGHRNAVVLIPQGGWGERVFDAFQEAWTVLGGRLLETAEYDPSQVDFRVPIQTALGLDASHQRYRALRSFLGHNLEFEPRRRMDVDFIFLAAFPEKARLLRPQISFHHAAHVPVYATSNVYAGYADENLDRDVEDVLFCDLPWILDDSGDWLNLRQQLQQQQPDEFKHYGRLQALGVDAYNVLPYLNQLGSGGYGYQFPGATGKLSMDPYSRLHRELVWATFKAGLIQSLETAHKE